MSKFFVGQRIKKVRGSVNVGVTGTVTGDRPHLLNELDGCDMCVHVDGTDIVGAAESKNWEPINLNHIPCESDFKASLDKLLEGLPA